MQGKMFLFRDFLKGTQKYVIFFQIFLNIIFLAKYNDLGTFKSAGVQILERSYLFLAKIH